jgi:YVTN family beta-propeller protein
MKNRVNKSRRTGISRETQGPSGEVCPMKIRGRTCAVILGGAGLMLASACNRAAAPEGSTTAAPAAESPAAPAAPALQGAYGVYVTNEQSGDLTVIDPATNTALATIPLGKRPRGIRSAPNGTQLYIALSGSPISPPGVDESTLPPPDRSADGIGVVDVKSLTMATILRGPSDPEQTSVSGDGTRLFIANEDTGKASVLEIASGKTIAEFEVGGEPEGVTTSTDGRFVYVTSEEENTISVIETATNKMISQFAVGARPRDSAFSPDSTRAYVTAENGGTVSVVDTAAHKVTATIKLTGTNVRPMGVVVSPDGQRVYVTTGRGGTVVAIDTATNTPVASVEVGPRPWGLAISPDGARLYTANGPSNDVSVVDTQSMTVVTKIPAGRSPWGVAIVRR